MICKICKKRNHRTSECFRKKNRVKNRKFSFQNNAPKITEPTKIGLDSKSLPGKTSLGQEPKTEEIKSDFKPVQNSNLGLKPLSGENSNLGLKPLTGGNSLNHKFVMLIIY